MPTAGVTAGRYAELLPCVEANLEALLRHAAVSNVLTVLGGPCSIGARPPGELRLRPVGLGQWIRRCTGLELVRSAPRDGDGVVDQVRALVGGGIPVLVYADAFTVAWNPYAGHEHHEHAFVVDGFDDPHGRLHVMDAYTNATRYGRAEPRDLWVDARELARSLRPADGGYRVEHLSGAAREADPAELGREIIGSNVRDHARARQEGRDGAALAAFAERDVPLADLAWLSLATWLITRSRRLHADWWRQSCLPADGSQVCQTADEVARRWQAAQTVSYLAWRRVEAGSACPPTLAGAIKAATKTEAEWFAAMDTWLAAAPLAPRP